MLGVLEVELPANAARPLIDQSVAQLQATDGVEEVAVLGRDDEEALLKPWLGRSFLAGRPAGADPHRRAHARQRRRHDGRRRRAFGEAAQARQRHPRRGPGAVGRAHGQGGDVPAGHRPAGRRAARRLRAGG
ncbi:MAG: hypothetical protein WDN72_07260 [Alphaproteobacteria bacterium]